MKPEIYISYSWKPESEKIAEQLESQLKNCGVELIRDKKNGVGYMESISVFMDKIGKGKYILMVLGNDYLKSHNCMYELRKIYEASEGDIQRMKERIFIVTLDKTEVYNPQDKALLTNYWEEQVKKLNEIIKRGNNILNYQPQMMDLQLFEDILKTIRTGVISDIADLNTLSTKTHLKEGFKTIISLLTQKLKEDGFEVDLTKVDFKSLEDTIEKEQKNPSQANNNPTTSIDKKALKDLFNDNEKDFFEKMESLLQYDAEALNGLIAKKNKLKKIKKDFKDEFITREQYDVDFAKIQKYLFELIDNLK